MWHHAAVTRQRREQLNGHKGALVWVTGLSGSGKSTIAHSVEEQLYERGCRTFVFDGDNVRHGLCSDLGFSREDRAENLRRIGEMSKLFVEAGIVALTAFISLFRVDREFVRDLAGAYRRGDILFLPDRGLRSAGRQVSVPAGARRRDRGIHRDLIAVRDSGESGSGAGHGHDAALELRGCGHRPSAEERNNQGAWK